jgi:uncharacterized membrane protein YvlD (DUF360 family)
MRDAYKRKANRLIRRRDALKKRIEVVKYMFKTDRVERIQKQLTRQYYSVVIEYDQYYPPNPDDILPTKFGNILKASESYAGTRYGLDGVEFWPRLIHVIPPPYQELIEGSRNELSFLVNMSFLAIVFFVLCVVAILYNFIGPSLNSVSMPLKFVGFGYAFQYAAAGLIALACNWLFNKASTFSVSSFGIMIRSAYDLFRLDLLEKFRLKMPTDSDKEFYMWNNLNELILQGEHSLTFEPLEYDVKKE